MGAAIRLESVSKAEAERLAEALRRYETSVESTSGVWYVEVRASDDDPDAVAAVLDGALLCYVEGSVTAFALLADGHRVVLGPRGVLNR